MNRRGTTWKRYLRWGLGALVALDLLLAVATLRDGGTEAQKNSLARLQEQHGPLAADVRHARNVRLRLPDVQQQCDRFYKDQLRTAGGGYSAIVADLGEIAEKAGLRTADVNFKEKVVEGRGVVEIVVVAGVEGEYKNLVRFINGLERSRNFYLMDSLALASSTGGNIKLNLELRTYFRS